MIKDFVNEIKSRGVARTNRFSVQITFPEGIGDFVDAEEMRLRCIQAVMPGISLTLSESEVSGTPKKVAISEGNDDIDLVFICGKDMREKATFDRWMNFIADPYSHRVAYYDDYVTDIIVSTLNESGEKTYSVKLVDAFPIAVTPIQLDATEQDSFIRLQVTFTAKKVVVV